MEFKGRYQNGLVAEVRDVHCVLDLAADPVSLVILDQARGDVLDRWPATQAYLLHSRMLELRIANRAKPPGARIAVSGIEEMRAAQAVLPNLTRWHRTDAARQALILVVATLALVAVILAYLFGVPLISDRLVAVIPPSWEVKVGDTAAQQIEASISNGKGYRLCDPDPNSVANRAIAGFVTRVFAGLDTPFGPTVTVIKTDIPNAFALPGGKTYYFSALLQASRSPEEFAGVLAHELGHVYYRHGMQGLIASSATGLLVGFVLGDMTGLSVAAAIGTSLIDNRFSRQSEAEADGFAGAAAQRLGYRVSGLADLLDRVAKDDAYSRALALFSNHPLTDARRQALEAMADVPLADQKAIFTAAEWDAIRRMCGPPAPLWSDWIAGG